MYMRFENSHYKSISLGENLITLTESSLPDSMYSRVSVYLFSGFFSILIAKNESGFIINASFSLFKTKIGSSNTSFTSPDEETESILKEGARAFLELID